MKHNYKKIFIGFALVFALAFVGIDAATKEKVLVSMNKQTANEDEAYQRNRINNKAEAFFSLANSKILEKDYSYAKNKDVKGAVDDKIKEIETSNPDILKEYDVKNMMELMEKTGLLVEIQQDQYVEDTYYKESITDKTIKALYDTKAGELTSYSVIKIDPTEYAQDPTKETAAKKDIEDKLAKVTDKTAKDVFAGLVKTYPGTDKSNGVKDSVKREEVEQKEVLAKIDTLKYLEVTKKPVIIDGVSYYILKTDNAKRLSFDASKDRLKELQFTTAKEKNASLVDYMLVQLREKNKVNLLNKVDQDVYDAATQEVKDSYNEALKAKDGE